MSRLDYRAALSGLNQTNRNRMNSMKCGPQSMKKHEQDKELIRDLILNQGISIDECAEKWEVHPMTICRLMGWV